MLSVITNQRPNFIWYEKEIPPTSAIYFDIIYGAGKYVAVGTHGTILSSDDGVNWELDCIGDISDPQLRAVTFGNNRFVAVGGNDIYTKSPTDEEWTKIELTAGYADLNDVIYVEGSTRR